MWKYAVLSAVSLIAVALWVRSPRPPIQPDESLDPDTLTDKPEPSRHVWHDECSALVVRTDCEKPLPRDAWVRPWRDSEFEYKRYIDRFEICMLGAPEQTALCPPVSRERWERERQAEMQRRSNELRSALERLPQESFQEDCNGPIYAEIQGGCTSGRICSVRRDLNTGEIQISACDFTVEEYKAKWGKAQR